MTTAPGLLTVVVVNYRGTDDTLACLESLQCLDWPRARLQVVVVDNASGDGGAAEISRAHPWAEVVESPANRGFAGGCNMGVARARGEYVGFLNNDARADEGWARAAVQVLESDAGVAAIACKVLDWDGSRVDFTDASMTWFGWGYKREAGRPGSTTRDEERDVLFGTGAAMFVRTDVFRDVGGFDERFFMFFEDVDLGWRLNLLGQRVRYVPGSVAYHRHHATVGKLPGYRETYLLERNAFLAMYKNYEDSTLERVLPAAMALAVRRSLSRAGVDATSLDLSESRDDESLDVTIAKEALTGPFAVDGLVSRLPGLQADRDRLQAARRRSDRDLVPLFRQALEPTAGGDHYLTGYHDLVRSFRIEELFAGRRRVAVVTGEPIKPAMAGPAIRSWEMASALARENDVVLGTLSPVCRLEHDDFATRSLTARGLRELENWCDVLVFQGSLLEHHPRLRDSGKVLVADVYDPFHLEVLEQLRGHLPVVRARAVENNRRAVNTQLRRADFLLCASPKQRDFWLGQLAGVGRINPLTYDEDDSLASLISVVPFGVPDEPPVKTRRVLKGVVDGIGADDKVVLWGGGVYNWFDPLTLVRAVDRLHQRRPEVRLYFLGMKHPNPEVPEMRAAWDTRTLSDELGLTGRVVFFNESWVPYEERQEYLLEADVGVSTHFDHIETAFSFRTRILDYLWAGLPVVATRGDSLADLVETGGLGRTVPSRDVDALDRALEAMLFDDEASSAAREAILAVRPTLAWSKVLEPLLDFCRRPTRAPDLVQRLGPAELPSRAVVARRETLRDDLAKVRLLLAEGGASAVARKATGRLRRVVERRSAR